MENDGALYSNEDNTISKGTIFTSSVDLSLLKVSSQIQIKRASLSFFALMCPYAFETSKKQTGTQCFALSTGYPYYEKF